MSQKTKLEIIQEAMERVGGNPFVTKLPEGTWRTIDRDPNSVWTAVIDLSQRPDGVWELPK